MKNKIRVGLLVFTIVIITAVLTIIDYGNLTWSKNSGSYLVIVGMICTSSSLILSILHEKKQQANRKDNSR